MTDILSDLFIFMEGNGICSKEYCYSILLLPPFLVILVFMLRPSTYLRTSRRRRGMGHLSWQQMERLAKDYYKENGFSVSVMGGAKADGGIDLIVRKKGRYVLVQVKHYKSKVGVKVVREMLGVFIDENKFDEVHLVTSSGFTKLAKELASRHNITLVDKNALLNR